MEYSIDWKVEPVKLKLVKKAVKVGGVMYVSCVALVGVMFLDDAFERHYKRRPRREVPNFDAEEMAVAVGAAPLVIVGAALEGWRHAGR